MSPIKKNILFISYDGMTDPLGQSQVIPYLRGLSGMGYRFFLLSCEKQEVYPGNKAAVDAMLEGYDIKWIPLKYTKKPPVISTLIDIFKLRAAARRIHKENGIDMVHTRPGVPALVGVWLKKKYGIGFLNDIREFYADSRVDGGMWDKKKYLYRSIYHYFRKKEAEQVKRSDGIVCLTYAAEKIIRQWPEYNARIPLAVIPCSVDLQLFDRNKIDAELQDALKRSLNIQPGDFIISYLGSIGGWYLTAEMMLFCKQLSGKIPAAKFLFISPHRHRQIVDTAVAYGLAADKVITTHAQRKEVPALLSLSAYSLFFIRPCYSKLSSSPTKHGEIMAMGIPVITNSGVGDVKEIVERYDGGFVIGQLNKEGFEQAIDAIAGNKGFDPAAIRNGAEAFYSLENAIRKYAEMYAAILGPHH